MTGVEKIAIDVDQLIAQIYQNIQQNPADGKARRDLILQLGEAGHGLNRETQLQVFQLLLDRCNVDDEDEVRQSARDALRLIWLAEWDTRQQVTLDQVLLALTDEMSDGLVRQQAADFIRLKAIDISKNDRMVDDTLEALISRANFDRDSRVKLTAGCQPQNLGGGLERRPSPETPSTGRFQPFSQRAARKRRRSR